MALLILVDIHICSQFVVKNPNKGEIFLIHVGIHYRNVNNVSSRKAACNEPVLYVMRRRNFHCLCSNCDPL